MLFRFFFRIYSSDVIPALQGRPSTKIFFEKSPKKVSQIFLEKFRLKKDGFFDVSS